MLKILNYNIWEGGRERSDRIFKIMKQSDADIIAVQEANDEHLFYTFAHALGMQAILLHSWVGYHVGLLSRYPVTEWNAHNDPAVFRIGALEAHVELPSGILHICSLHLQARYSTSMEEKRTQEAQAVVAAMSPYFDEKTLLLGDFNTLSPHDIIKPEDWNPAWYKKVEHMPRTSLRVVLDAGYTDCYRYLYSGTRYQDGYTLPAVQPNVRLDYQFASPTLLPHLRSCEVITEPDAGHASDHLPVLATYEL
jgi:endonuclease/exonuclease/phosphatase family metal-dependent hydrolase